MLDRIRPQVSELLLGFYDVVPETLLIISDYQELELVMCGLPTVDLSDWTNHTLFTGSYNAKSKPCQWFWEVVKDDFDQEMKAKLLQFVTGTSGVPSRGFEVLQGGDGNIKKITLHVVDIKTVMYPRAQYVFEILFFILDHIL
jgi:E3 ubiquitin-protein ligase NEDD4